MFLNLTVSDAANKPRGSARLRLDFGQNLWSLEEEKEQVWTQHVGFSKKGSFELKDHGGGVAWIWDIDPKGKRRNTVILWTPPKGESESKNLLGRARIFDPNDAALKEGEIKWAVDASAKPGLAKIRAKALQIIEEIPLPPEVGRLLTPGKLPMTKIDTATHASVKGLTNCGALPGYVAGLLEPARNVTGKVKGTFQKKDPTSPTGFKWVNQSFEVKITDKISSGMEQFASDPRVNAWVPFTGSNQPEPGDFYVLDKDETDPKKKGFSHVGIFIRVEKETGAWITADSGQGDELVDASDPEKDYTKKRRIYDKGMAAGYRRRYLTKDGKITGEPTQSKDLRILKGWLNLDSPILFPTLATPKKNS